MCLSDIFVVVNEKLSNQQHKDRIVWEGKYFISIFPFLSHSQITEKRANLTL